MHPGTLTICRIPIYLAAPLGSASNLLLNTRKEGMDRVKVKDNGMFRSLNDNCSTATRTGRLLLCDGDEEEQDEIPDGSCDVNFANLHGGIDLSVVTRSSEVT